MSFADSIRTCFSKYATFSGRARRSEYWWFYLFYILCTIVLEFIVIAARNGLPFILLLGVILPSLAAMVRRLHDTGRSGWWFWIGVIPIVGAIILIVFLCQNSQPGTNQYGPSPKEAGGPSGYYTPQAGY